MCTLLYASWIPVFVLRFPILFRFGTCGRGGGGWCWGREGAMMQGSSWTHGRYYSAIHRLAVLANAVGVPPSSPWISSTTPGRPCLCFYVSYLWWPGTPTTFSVGLPLDNGRHLFADAEGRALGSLHGQSLLLLLAKADWATSMEAHYPLPLQMNFNSCF